MKISNYLLALANQANLYLVTNEELLRILERAYSEIKLSIGSKKFISLVGLDGATITAVLRKENLPSLKLIKVMAENVKWDLWKEVYQHLEFMRGKTNSNIVKMPKILTKDLAYLLGAFRDGSMVHYSHVYELEYGQKNYDWLQQVIKPKIKNVFGLDIETKKRKNGSFILRKRSKVIFSILNQFLSYDNNYLLTPNVVLNAPFEIQKHYIAGFYDAEGRKKITDMNVYQQWYLNECCPPLDDIKNILTKNNIETKYYKTKPQNNAFLFTLHIEGKTKRAFLNEIPLQHPYLVKLF